MAKTPVEEKVVELSEEEVMSNDIDPLEAIAQIRRDEGVPEEDIIVSDSTDSSQEEPAAEVDGEDELDNLKDEETADDADTSTESDEDDTKDADADESEDGSDDTDSESEDDKSDENEEKPAEVKKHTFKANGQEFEFTEEEMLEQFEGVFGKAVNFTEKTQKLAPYRKMISALEEQEISSDQLNLAIDAIKGNPDALKKLMADNKIDAYDLTNDDDGEKNSYTPPEYGKNDTALAIKDVTDLISGDEEYKITVNVIDEQWDDKSRDTLISSPDMIQGLHNDIKSGLYDQVAPRAYKMKVLDGNTKSDIEYYMLAGAEVNAEKQESGKTEEPVTDKTDSTQDVEDNFDQASSEAQRKRAASPTRKRADKKGVIDYLNDDDDEGYDAWRKKLDASI